MQEKVSAADGGVANCEDQHLAIRGSGRQTGKTEVRREDLPSFLVSSGDFKFDYEPLECRGGKRGEFGDKGD